MQKNSSYAVNTIIASVLYQMSEDAPVRASAALESLAKEYDCAALESLPDERAHSSYAALYRSYRASAARIGAYTALETTLELCGASGKRASSHLARQMRQIKARR